MTPILLDGESLTLATVARFLADPEAPVSLAPAAAERVRAARRVVDEIVASGRVAYGITTGFGRLAEVRIPADDTDRPLESIWALMTSSYEVLLEHADLVPVYLARQGSSGPRAQRLGEVTLGLLERAGVSGERAREGLRVLIVYTIGFAAINPGTSGTIGTGPRLTANELRHNFERGLRWLLAGIAGVDWMSLSCAVTMPRNRASGSAGLRSMASQRCWNFSPMRAATASHKSCFFGK